MITNLIRMFECNCFQILELMYRRGNNSISRIILQATLISYIRHSCQSPTISGGPVTPLGSIQCSDVGQADSFPCSLQILPCFTLLIGCTSCSDLPYLNPSLAQCGQFSRMHCPLYLTMDTLCMGNELRICINK